MAREVHSSDFSDEELLRFFKDVERLTWSGPPNLPDDVAAQAEAFAESPPRPTPEEMRDHIDQAVALARGWDHPDKPNVMLHSAIKAYYLMHWFDHVVTHADAAGHTAAYRVRFSPSFRSADPTKEPPPSTRHGESIG